MSRLVLGLETSCDETSAAVIADGRRILSNVISSQIPIHQKYGGVVPELASRRHLENVVPVIDQALTEAGVTLADLDGVGVTHGPGLVGALLVGVAAAKALAFAAGIPLLGVHHLEGHIFAALLTHPELEPPFVSLVVSGGHTSLVHVRGYSTFGLLGQTRDDAAGEAFDKVARLLGLPYPGGPHVEQLAVAGNPAAIHFPRSFTGGESFEFSFSGLKSAVINYLHTAFQRKEPVNAADVAASFQAAVVDVLVQKALQAVRQCGGSKLVLAGGVAANGSLRRALQERCSAADIGFYYPDSILCTDNAAMIGCRAYYQLLSGDIADLSLNAIPGLPLGGKLK
ncbi:MAG: tRNA (adenosine(37)-N6)-threonylcarbamoyltransferase complex transferase subunit TsaD [Negativicutes bacterium]